MPFNSFGGAIGFDHVVPPSALSTTPVPVSTNIRLASVPKTGPERASFSADTVRQVAPRSPDAISSFSTSQYKVSPRHFGWAWALAAPTGL